MFAVRSRHKVLCFRQPAVYLSQLPSSSKYSQAIILQKRSASTPPRKPDFFLLSSVPLEGLHHPLEYLAEPIQVHHRQHRRDNVHHDHPDFVHSLHLLMKRTKILVRSTRVFKIHKFMESYLIVVHVTMPKQIHEQQNSCNLQTEQAKVRTQITLKSSRKVLSLSVRLTSHARNIKTPFTVYTFDLFIPAASRYL